MAVGLQYGFLVGRVAGLISFVPYVGSVVGLLLSIGIALFQFWDEKVWIWSPPASSSSASSSRATCWRRT